MFIQKVDVLANELFKTADLNVIRAEDGEDGGDGGDGGPPRTTFDAMRYLNPQDVRQYLYCLSAADGSTAEQVMAATTIGKLEIVWRTNLGELGRLQVCAAAVLSVDIGFLSYPPSSPMGPTRAVAMPPLTHISGPTLAAAVLARAAADQRAAADADRRGGGRDPGAHRAWRGRVRQALHRHLPDHQQERHQNGPVN